ncbi:hypothetical protein [Falsarthrobacter nasiphocae]|uniref:Uncharacterized protein n=1 Tax=Falsarthrobacter nasiphocae TaxID=189863 RepID=A0AAE3YHJ1_9MICC|nr:hypothetical protein [Falsarthrobacter nasiphocae]MDR6892832.1 hypothetical protein [Falsarthrobacter nasiphocae]
MKQLPRPSAVDPSAVLEPEQDPDERLAGRILSIVGWSLGIGTWILLPVVFGVPVPSPFEWPWGVALLAFFLADYILLDFALRAWVRRRRRARLAAAQGQELRPRGE